MKLLGYNRATVKFLSTPSARRATGAPLSRGVSRRISIHALREEGDFAASPAPCWYRLFLSTPSARRATAARLNKILARAISIHALREEGDQLPWRGEPFSKISIHALREEGDALCFRHIVRGFVFLSTPSARRATRITPPTAADYMISIHALREEGDFPCGMSSDTAGTFLSTPSARRATLDSWHYGDNYTISIHALREEGDRFFCRSGHFDLRFLSTPSARRATLLDLLSRMTNEFLSTPSARRATPRLRCQNQTRAISIHALREEGDRCRIRSCCSPYLFLSTPSARRATRKAHVPLGAQRNFYPRPPRGGRQQKQRQNLYFQTNYTTFCTNLEEP